MGEKVVFGIVLLGLVSAMFMIFGGSWPQHRVSFFTLMAARVLRVETTLLTARIDANDNDFCFLINQIKPDFCDRISGENDLLDISQRFCAPAIEAVYPQACVGLTRAYLFGIIVVICMALAIVMQAIACGLLAQYAWQSAKRQYRLWATGLLAMSASLYAVSLLAYALLALLELDHLEPHAGIFAHLAFAPNRGPGVAKGYLLQWVACLVQVIMIVLTQMVRSSEEAAAEEQRLLKHAHAEDGLGAPLQPGDQQSWAQPQDFAPAGYGATGVFMPSPPPSVPIFTGEALAPQAASPQAMAPQGGQPQAMRPAW